MIAENTKDKAQADAAALLYAANMDDIKRRHAQAYEDFILDQKRRENYWKQREQELRDKLAGSRAELADSRAELADKDAALADSKAEYNRLMDWAIKHGYEGEQTH